MESVQKMDMRKCGGWTECHRRGTMKTLVWKRVSENVDLHFQHSYQEVLGISRDFACKS